MSACSAAQAKRSATLFAVLGATDLMFKWNSDRFACFRYGRSQLSLDAMFLERNAFNTVEQSAYKTVITQVIAVAMRDKRPYNCSQTYWRP